MHCFVCRWKTDTKRITSGLDSGPLVLFDRSKNALVISSFSNFMAGSAMYDVSANSTTAYMGLIGSAKEVPAGFSYWTVMYYDVTVNAVCYKFCAITLS